jgi:hypothetical protein
MRLLPFMERPSRAAAIALLAAVAVLAVAMLAVAVRMLLGFSLLPWMLATAALLLCICCCCAITMATATVSTLVLVLVLLCASVLDAILANYSSVFICIALT